MMEIVTVRCNHESEINDDSFAHFPAISSRRRISIRITIDANRKNWEHNNNSDRLIDDDDNNDDKNWRPKSNKSTQSISLEESREQIVDGK